jgi:DNA-binding IclR family transcriptional regulator
MSDSSGRSRRGESHRRRPAGEPSYSRHSVSVDRGFAILERFSGERGSESIADISAAVQLPRSSVHRYLQTLAALGLVEQRGTPRRRYRLTAGASAPGIVAIASTGLQSVARNELVALRRGTSCTARVAVRVELDALLIAHARSFAEGQAMLTCDVRPGARLQGEHNALGQVLLANLRVDQLPPNLRQQGQYAYAALAKVREQGYATQRDDRVCALAVPVLLETGETVAALDLIGCPPNVTPQLLHEHLAKMHDAAGRLAREIAELPWSTWPQRLQPR